MSIALGHMHHAYAQTDGTYKFPDSREGDILKQAKKELEELQAQVDEQSAFATKCVNKISRFRAALNHISRHFGSAEQCREIAQAAINGEK